MATTRLFMVLVAFSFVLGSAGDSQASLLKRSRKPAAAGTVKAKRKKAKRRSWRVFRRLRAARRANARLKEKVLAAEKRAANWEARRDANTREHASVAEGTFWVNSAIPGDKKKLWATIEAFATKKVNDKYVTVPLAGATGRALLTTRGRLLGRLRRAQEREAAAERPFWIELAYIAALSPGTDLGRQFTEFARQREAANQPASSVDR